MADSRTTVLIPVNRLDRAKGRLEGALDSAQRSELALTTLETVVTAALAAELQVVILTADATVAGWLGGRGRVIPESPSAEGLTGQLEFALGDLGGDADVLILHGDLPLASGPAIRKVLGAGLGAATVTMVRSPDGGTNALRMRPGERMPLAYGPGSFGRHALGALLAGLSVTEVREPALELDLDTPADLELLMSTPEGRESAAGKLLEAWGIGA